MHLLLNVHSSNPETTLDCDCAVLEITKPLCGRLRRDAKILFRHVRELPDLYEVYFWRYAVEFYCHDLVDACDDCEPGWSDQFENHGHAVLPTAVNLSEFEPQRTECQQEIFRYQRAASNIVRHPEACFEICWIVTPKHSDTYVTTRDVTLQKLLRYRLT